MTSTPVIPAADPIDAVMTPQAPRSNGDKTFFGEVVVADAYFVTKGANGERVWDPTADPVDKRYTRITISIQPLRGQYSIDAKMVDFGKEWSKFTLPSLMHLGISFRQLNGAFVRFQRKATGETYTDKNTGEEKDRTALVFLEVYPSREACQTAADAFFQNLNQHTNDSAAQPDPAAPDMSGERDFARQSLAMLWQAARQDKQAFLAMIQSNPMISRHFSPSSPEVTALIGS